VKLDQIARSVSERGNKHRFIDLEEL